MAELHTKERVNENRANETMYLKSLEILGFKSFATRTVLNFHRGVTAVVGPNGCGKSNVLDSIRWVLGEQSAKALRGGEMADVIFSGTDSRKPLGMAEVSLTFGDCEKELGVEWNEVCITRRVYRDGKSEYLLNKTPCRLRDIHELFMDTGIGRSAYSIMEQGKIDQILSSRPEDRRAIFEEAAGITKFKAQKKEALRKLDYTEANLLRVTDIIKEVKRQIGSLQRQAAKARRYKTLTQDLRTLDTHLSRKRYDAFEQDISQITEKLSQLNHSFAEKEDALAQGENNLRQQRHELEAVEYELSEARQQVQSLKNRIQNAESRIGFNAERHEEFQSLITRYQEDIATVEEKLQEQQGQIEEADQQLEQLSTSLKAEEEQLASETTRTNEIREKRSELQIQQQSALQNLNRLESELIKAQAQLQSAKTQVESSDARLQILASDISTAVEQSETLSTRNSQARTQLESLIEHRDQKRDELRTAEIELSESRELLKTTESTIHEQQRSLAQHESRLQVLRQLLEAGEGFSKGAQAILKGLDRPDFYKGATMGALASLLDVEPEFVPAIEAALGNHLHTIILKDLSVAEAAIDFLAKSREGRASLSSPELMPRPSALQLETLPEGAIAWALDKVKAPPEIQPLISQILNLTVIVPNLTTALQLRTNYPHLYFVTTNAETLSTQGVLTGGQEGAATNSILQRKNEIQALEEQTHSLERTLQEFQQQQQTLEETVLSHTSRVELLREEVQTAHVNTSTLEGQLAMMDRELREIQGKVESLQWEQTSLLETHHSSQSSISDFQNTIRSHEQEIELLRSQRYELESSLHNFTRQEEDITTSLNDLRVRVATSKQHYQSLMTQRQPMNHRIQELKELQIQRTADIQNYTDKIGDLEASNLAMRREIEEVTAQLSQSEENVEATLVRRSSLAEVLQTADHALSGLRRELSQIQDERGRLEVKQTQLQIRIENILEHAQRRYQLDLREFRFDGYGLLSTLREADKRAKRKSDDSETSETSESPESPETEEVSTPEEATIPSHERQNEIDWLRVELLVEELTQKVDSMGPVNLDAIQEFEELEERHTFLENQFADLTNSKVELLNVLTKINTTTRELFADTFEKIRVNFQEMFKELFGEGARANLILTDDSDPLESGIDIIAKPPGKQLQSITLLSGGEKTMTAVALLFSIYMVKPSPFCVLDEMDAPLDESNINRFIKILDRFLNQSQFVVITHNKRTIAKADVLYGVTMEEQGVSKLVGVRLSKSDTATSNQSQSRSIAESFGKSGNLTSEDAPEPAPTASDPVPQT